MRTTKITNPSSLTLIASLVLSSGVYLYLTRLHLVTKYGFEPTSQLCNISSKINCNAAISSAFSEILNVPLALFALITTLTTLFFVFKFFFLSPSKSKEQLHSEVVFSLVGLAAAASIIMALVSIFILKTLCPFCTAAYFLSFIALGSSFFVLSYKSISAGTLKTLILSGLAILGISFASGKIAVNKFENSEMREIYGLIIEQWKQSPPQKIEVFNPIRAGTEGSKMRIVEYADFLCGHCMMAASKVDTFLKGHKDVEFIFQAFPLDGCEKTNNKYGKSCELALFSLCANQQGHGYETNEILFNSQPLLYQDPISDLTKEGLSPELSKISRSAFLDSSKIVACMKDPQTMTDLLKQKEFASKALSVNSTPTFYINDKLIKGAANLPVLQMVYKEVSK